MENDKGAVFDLKMSDSDIIGLLKTHVTESDNYWNNTQGLSDVRKKNLNMWLPNHWQDKDVYTYQEESLYQENRAFLTTETIASVINSRIAQPEIMPAQDTIISLQVAKDVRKVIESYCEKYNIVDLFRIAARDLIMKRGGPVIKFRFDPSIGQHGEIVMEHVIPEDIFVDQDAKLGDIPRFYAHKIHNKTGEELLSLYPEAEQKIYELLEVKRQDKNGNLVAYKSQLQKKVDLYEIWFRYWDEDKWGSGRVVVDTDFQIVLDKGKNPNWNYSGSNERAKNLLDNPTPPFISINFLNDGSSFYDLTSLLEQIAPLQSILDRRGFQIMENADQASSGLVYNTEMIGVEEVAKLVGSPDERLGVKGDVRSAFARLPAPSLPSYVIQDKNDLRFAIDDIMGTHNITRGTESGSKTLGQDQLQREQDYGRMDDIARAVERMAKEAYRYLLQMMKVYYTEDHYFKAVGEDGQFDFVVINSDLIEDGIDVKITAGSTKPMSRSTQRAWMVDLINANMVDPLTVYEVVAGGDMPSPKKMLERFVLYTTDPQAFAGAAQEDETDRNAFMDVQILNASKVPKMRDEYTPKYFQFMNKYMATGEFMKQKDYVKQLYVEYLREAQMIAQKQLEALMTQLPTQQELDIAAQKEVKQVEMANQMMSGQPSFNNQPGEKGVASAPKPSGAMNNGLV